MNRIQVAYTFTNEETNIIRDALIALMRSMEDEDGRISHLSMSDKKKYAKIADIYYGL